MLPSSTVVFAVLSGTVQCVRLQEPSLAVYAARVQVTVTKALT